jgi:RNA polymerase sigma factor (sigma-70 family)
VAWRRIDVVPAGAEARPWLYGVARKVLSNHHRGDRRRHRLSERVAAQMSPTVVPSISVEDGPDREAIAAAFSQLREDDQELLRLVGWEQLDRDEIAEIVGVSRAVVRVRLHRARRRFEKALNAAGVQRSASPGHVPGRWATALPDPEEAV